MLSSELAMMAGMRHLTDSCTSSSRFGYDFEKLLDLTKVASRAVCAETTITKAELSLDSPIES